MNTIRTIFRAAPTLNNAVMSNYAAFRPLSATVSSVTKPLESPSPAPIELDKLYKRVELEMRGIDPAVLLSYSWFCVAAASHLGIEVTKSILIMCCTAYSNGQGNSCQRLANIYSKDKENNTSALQAWDEVFACICLDPPKTVLPDCWTLRKAEKERLTLLKSVHIFKKHKVQYEVRTHFRFVHLQRLTGSTCDTYLEYIERNLPEGCALKVTKIECQKMPEHLTPPSEV